MKAICIVYENIDDHQAYEKYRSQVSPTIVAHDRRPRRTIPGPWRDVHSVGRRHAFRAHRRARIPLTRRCGELVLLGRVSEHPSDPLERGPLPVRDRRRRDMTAPYKVALIAPAELATVTAARRKRGPTDADIQHENTNTASDTDVGIDRVSARPHDCHHRDHRSQHDIRSNSQYRPPNKPCSKSTAGTAPPLTRQSGR